jgi:hypothetical protein
MLAGLVIWIHPSAQIVDPMCTFLFSFLVLATTKGTIQMSLKVLMEATPEGVDYAAIKSEMKAIPGVTDVHDLHIWCLSQGKPALSVHIGADDPQTALQQAEQICRKHDISHSTIQVQETGAACITQSCEEGDCSPTKSQMTPSFPKDEGHAHAHGGEPCSGDHGSGDHGHGHGGGSNHGHAHS